MPTTRGCCGQQTRHAHAGPAPALPSETPTSVLTRRTLLQGAAGLGGLVLGAGSASASADAGAAKGRPPRLRRSNRVRASLRYRVRQAKVAAARPLHDNQTNGDEDTLEHFVGNYTKALPHVALGHVDPAAYDSLRRACASGRREDFDVVTLGSGRRLTSAQAAYAFDLQGCDSHHTHLPPPPAFSSADEAAEMTELYWMALCRDVPFAHFGTDPLCAAAATELSSLADFRGARAGGLVTPGALFRGGEAGCEVGPYLSQFLWQNVPYGAQTIPQRSQTGVAGVDWMTDFASWLAVQNGADPRGTDVLDPARPYLRDLRGLARWVQIDALYQGYLNACLILLGMRAPMKPGIPAVSARTCEGFVDWGPPHLLALLCEVSTRALKAVWYHKWAVHRRVRPEAFAGCVDNHLAGRFAYPIYSSVLDSDAVARVLDRHGTALLPMAFPEGSPTHPAYGAGHATVAGTCTTILKAWFDEDWVIPAPVVATADGNALVAWDGEPLTVGGELNKVAANVAIGRNGAGVHWQSDYYHSLRLGEYVAKTILEEQKPSYNQSPTFEFRSFDGHTVTI